MSTEDQARKGYSLPEQIRECRARATSLGATEVFEFTDDVSGDLLDRPGLNAAREAIRRGGVRWFICYDPDRFSRNLMNQLVIADEIERKGVSLVFVAHNYDQSPEGKLFFQIRGSIAEFEKAKILERTARGKRGKMRKGALPAYVDCFGYDFVKGQGTLMVNETEAAWVKRIFDWFTAEQLSLRSIVERLNDMGAPAARGTWWYRSSLRRVLTNRIYTGTLWVNRYDTTRETRARMGTDSPTVQIRAESEWIGVPVPALISQEQWDAAQQLLVRSKHQREKQDGSGHLLSGMLTCGRCGHTIRYKNNSRWTRYLACSRRFEYRDLSPEQQVKCDLPYVKAEPVEQFVCETVRNWIFNPDKLREVIDERRQGKGHETEADELAQVTAQIVATEKERRNLTQLYRKDLVDHDEAERDLLELRKRLDRLNARKEELQAIIGQAESANPEEKVEALSETLERLREVWDSLEPEDRRYTVRLLVEKVVIRGKDKSEWDVIPLP